MSSYSAMKNSESGAFTGTGTLLDELNSTDEVFEFEAANTAQSGNALGTITYELTSDVCPNPAINTIDVVVETEPSKPVLSWSEGDEVCVGETNTVTATIAEDNADTYVWSNPTGASLITTSPEKEAEYEFNVATTTSVSLAVSNMCNTVSSDALDIKVNGLPSPMVDLGDLVQTICVNNAYSADVISLGTDTSDLGGATSFRWYIDDVLQDTTAGTYTTPAITSDVELKVEVSSLAICSEYVNAAVDSVNLMIIVPSAEITGDTNICLDVLNIGSQQYGLGDIVGDFQTASATWTIGTSTYSGANLFVDEFAIFQGGGLLEVSVPVTGCTDPYETNVSIVTVSMPLATLTSEEGFICHGDEAKTIDAGGSNDYSSDVLTYYDWYKDGELILEDQTTPTYTYDRGGVYTVKITNEHAEVACSDMTTTGLTIDEFFFDDSAVRIAELTQTGDASIDLEGGVYSGTLYDADDYGVPSYSWSIVGEGHLAGIDGTTGSFDQVANGDSIVYTVHYGDCSSSKSIEILKPSDGTYSFEELATGDLSLAMFEVSPNPSTGFVEIKTESPIISVQVLDMRGEVLLETDIMTLDLTSLKYGIYLLDVQTQDGHGVMRVIKE